MNIRKNLAFQLRCIKDERCYLAYTNEKKSWFGKIDFWRFLDMLERAHVSDTSLLFDVIDWSLSIKGAEYWANKWRKVEDACNKLGILTNKLE